MVDYFVFVWFGFIYIDELCFDFWQSIVVVDDFQMWWFSFFDYYVDGYIGGYGDFDGVIGCSIDSIFLFDFCFFECGQYVGME